ncbi:MAG: HTH domain-containing protein [Sorangiineae bacterium]|nr:HTH domain-containing protein [Polyangiaceae bacterium]MEB2322415.1 HTH domain-containing protein [Sorangiineae bacterium]
MTFTEAAAQVLRLVGKPLHYKEITDVAIEQNLLSHVGKSPEVTMGARLAALVKKNDKENPLVRIKPGVFALREWDQRTIDRGLADRTPALDRIAAHAAAAVDVAAPPAPPEASRPNDALDEEAPPPDEEELTRAKMAAKASEIFAPEEDDDLPIFAEEAGDAATGDDETGAEGGRRRRRRPRHRRPEDERGGGELPAYTVSDVPTDLVVDAGEPAPERSGRERGGRERDSRERDSRERDGRERDSRERDGRERDGRERDSRERDSREREGRRGGRSGSVDELAGRDAADLAAELLSSLDRSGGPVGFHKLAELAQRRHPSSGEAGQLAGALAAAVRADNLRRADAGQRQRFRVQGSRVALTDWLLDGELSRLERDLGALVDRYREASRRLLLRRLQELPPRGLGELVMLLLERLGVTSLEVVRRPGSASSELHLSGRTTGPLGELRVAVVVRRDGRELGRERVTEVRGALHHYGPAQAAWLVTTGQVLSGAREEAAAPGAAPCTLIDGIALARLCEEHGVAVTSTRVSLALPDLELLETLRGG